jgi:hypothetical protein
MELMPIHVAALYGNVEAAKAMLDRDPGLVFKVSPCSPRVPSPSPFAIYYNQNEIAILENIIA